MSGFVCSVCGQVHDGLPLGIGHALPADYFAVPESQRERRVKATDDYCIIDGKEFYIRGVLPVPIAELNDEFRFGLWTRIGKRDFDRYLEAWENDVPKDEPIIIGYLSGGTKAYTASDQTAVTVYLQNGNQRPRFFTVSDDHPLGKEQRQGLTMKRVHELWEIYGIKM
jgi:hypothetical protein